MKSFHDGKIVFHAGDCMEVLRTMPADSIDAVVTDPPYHLTSIVKRFGGENAAAINNRDEKQGRNGPYHRASKGFMGKQWDGGDIAFRPELWAEVLRVLKPGGHMICFGGTRTYHRMVCAIEDAGFEIRDQVAWVYSQGFPKSHDVSKGIDRAAGVERDVLGKAAGMGKQNPEWNGTAKGRAENSFKPEYDLTAPATDAARQWQGWGTALKPAFEPICLARKPLSESTVAANVLKHGVGALNIDSCRIAHSSDDDLATSLSKNPGRSDLVTSGIYGSDRPQQRVNTSGRWPANLCHDGSPEVLEGFPDVHGAGAARNGQFGGDYEASSYDMSGPREMGRFGDSGSAARFFASFPREEDQCQSPIDHANYAESSFILSSEVAASVLMRAVGATTGRLELHLRSYRAQDTNVSGQLLDEIETLLIAVILNIEKKFSRELPLERLSLSDNHANVVATPKPTGTITITINLLKSNGFVEAVTFDLTETSSEAGAKGYAKRFHYDSKADADDRLGSRHPTIKPVTLMCWLVRLICPKGSTVLDPFAGTGTTGAAAFIEGCRAVLIEREAEYLADIERRMGMLLSGQDERARKLATPDPHDSLPLFAVMS